MYKFAINRPIATLMGVIAFIVFGLMSYKSMPVALFPNVDFPIVTVETRYPGADPATVESKVTDKIEEVISGIDGIDKLNSTSYEGLSVVTVVFELERDITEAANDVRDKVGALMLQDDIEKPIVKKLGATGGVINLFIASKTGDMQAMMRMADEKIKPKLQRVRGVGEVDIVGFREREIRIFANPYLLNKYSLSVYELQNIISNENYRMGGGKLVGENNEIVVKARGDAGSMEEIKNIIILPGVRLKDVAEVKDGLEDADSYSSLNGTPGVMLEVKKISGSNALNIIEGVKKIYPEIEKIAGDDYNLQLLQDQSEKINIHLDRVEHDLILGAILAVGIVFFFLRNVTATIVSSLALPASIIGTFALMDWLGYDLNRLSMIGLTLAIGIFIDDAIVVIENISKKLEAGMEPFEAAYEGISEIAFSILAISAMLLSVFIPVAFMGGMVGKFFNSFAVTVAAGVIISYFVAVMLIPSVGARVLKGGESRFYTFTEPFFISLDRAYVSVLKPLIRFKYLTLIGAVLILFGSGFLSKKLGMNFLPTEDNSEFQILVKGDVGSSLESMKKNLQPILNEINRDENVDYWVQSIGYNTAKETHKARIYVRLLPLESRKFGQEEIMRQYSDKLTKFKDLTISVEKVPYFDTGTSNAPLQVIINGSDFQKLEEVANNLISNMSQMQGIANIDMDYEKGKPEVKVTLQREGAKRLDVSAEAIARVLSSAYSADRSISNFEDSGKQFDLTLRFSDEFREKIDDLKRLQVRTSDGNLVFIDGLVNFEESKGETSVNRFDRERSILVTSGVFGAPLDGLVAQIDSVMGDILPDGYSYTYLGDVERMQDTGEAFGAVVLLAIILIYLILAALYESLIQPFIIMIALPLSFIGVLLALYWGGHSFSIFVLIGIILLMGMVGKNAILVVDFANRAIKNGAGVDKALIQAGEKRLRPILMTSCAMIFAMAPLAFGGGAGHESNAPMALAVIGGLISSTILTLLVVPAVYRIFYPLDAWLRKYYERNQI